MKLRATTRGGSMTLVPYRLPSVYGGPAACLARAALGPDVSIADLTIGEPPEEGGADDEEMEMIEADDPGPGEGEVEVRFMVNDVPPARRVIKRWAAAAGYRRIWFRDEVADLAPRRRRRSRTADHALRAVDG